MSGMKIVRLEDISAIKPFDCGDSDLNEFLLKDAALYQQQFLASTYIIEDDDRTIAFYSLLNDKISKSNIPQNLWCKVRKEIPHSKHMGSYPAVKIGRLGVSLSQKGNRIGSQILEGIRITLITNRQYSACRFLTVDAYKEAVPFYEKNGFIPLLNQSTEELTVPMYLDLKKYAMNIPPFSVMLSR